jgi:ribosomal protein L37AE/L43A
MIEHDCKKCGHHWTQRSKSIIPPRTCPKCGLSTWQKPWGQAYTAGPLYKIYGIRRKIPVGKDGAITIITNYYQAQYSKIG